MRMRASGARFQTLPSCQSPRSILRSMALTEYPVSRFASGSSTYRAVPTTIGALVVWGPAISKFINDLVWFRSFRAKVVTQSKLSQKERKRVGESFDENSAELDHAQFSALKHSAQRGLVES